MDNRILKVFVACALGAGMGSFIALNMHPYLWWVGAIVGAFIIGYLAYEPKKVILAIPVAWEATWRTIASPSFRKESIRFFAAFLVGISLASSFFVLFFLLHILMRAEMDGKPILLVLGIVQGSVWGLSIWLYLFCILEDNIFKGETGKHTSGQLMKIAALLSPLGVAIIPLVITRLIIIKTPKAARFTVILAAIFFKSLFLIIHSEIRLLCGVDAVIGAGIGYFLGNPLLGALIGGAIGVANYKIVSQYILHLVPKRS